MKQLGITQEDVPSKRVIIEKQDNSKIIIDNPSVMKMSIQGQEMFQIQGDIKEEEAQAFTEEDIKTIVEKTGKSEKEAREALEKTQDLAEAILELSD